MNGGLTRCILTSALLVLLIIISTLSLTGGEGDGNQYAFSGAERRARETGEAIEPVAIAVGLGIGDGLLTIQGYPDLITSPATN